MNVLDVSYNHIYFHPCVHSSIGQCGGLLSRCVCSTLHLPVELFRVCDEERASEGLAALSQPSWRSISLPSLEPRKIESIVLFISRLECAAMATAAPVFTIGQQQVRRCCSPTCTNRQTLDFTAAWISMETSNSRIPANCRSTLRSVVFVLCIFHGFQ